MTLSPLSIEDLHWWVASIPSAFNVVRHSHMTLSPLSIEDLHWWMAPIPSAFNVVRHSDYDLVLHTDASTTGWGGVMGDISTGGQ